MMSSTSFTVSRRWHGATGWRPTPPPPSSDGPANVVRSMDPRILVHAAGVAGAPVERRLFVDDSAADVDAARRLGMRAALFTGIETLPELGHPLRAARDAPGRDRAG